MTDYDAKERDLQVSKELIVKLFRFCHSCVRYLERTPGSKIWVKLQVQADWIAQYRSFEVLCEAVCGSLKAGNVAVRRLMCDHN